MEERVREKASDRAREGATDRGISSGKETEREREREHDVYDVAGWLYELISIQNRNISKKTTYFKNQKKFWTI